MPGGHLQEMTSDDMVLVQAYAAEQSEAAFATLVSRHVGLVHSAALRQLRDEHLAQDVTQAVFVLLARKAGSLSPETVVSGWLYRATLFACADVRRREMRRQQREQEALMEASIESQTSDHQTVWNTLAPVLEEAMTRLRDRDRDALVLRFFENKSMKEIAATLGLEERTAQKRVQRALEKLRGSFARRGITFSAALISSAIAANSVNAAPASVNALATAAAVGRRATESSDPIIRGVLKAMVWAKLKFALTVGAAVVFVGATTIALAQLSPKITAAPTNTVTAAATASEPAALIVVGLLASDAPEPIQALAAQTKENLIARGWPADRVQILSGKVTREQVLQTLHNFSEKAGDEFWLVLLGQCGKAQGGVPAFQVAGPRLTPPDLKAALDAIPGRQFVFIGTGNAGGFLPPLRSDRRTVLAATQAEGEPDQPRFLSAWVKEFGAASKAPLAEIAARAANDVSEQCKQANMAQSEHAQLADAATGKILEAPFVQ
ncbi:MAG TPA: sigma-70 family RNA polymerase sigma factor [Verrucomicrobiae bacterium]